MELRKTKNNLIFLVFAIQWGCVSDSTTVDIGAKKNVTIVGENGKVEITFSGESMMLSNITIYDSNKNLIFTQNEEGDGLISSGTKKTSGDSISLKKFKSYLVDRNSKVINDSLSEEMYHSLYTTR